MLNASAAVDLPSFWYDIKCRLAGTQSWQRGVYLREPGEAAGTVNVTVDATPQLHEDADVTSERLVVEHKLMLRSTAPWISCPDLLLVRRGTSLTYATQLFLSSSIDH